MKTLLNVRSMFFGLSIVTAVLIGMAQGPRNVADEWTALFSGMGPEDPCVYSEYSYDCPDAWMDGGCTLSYNKYEGWGYLTVLDKVTYTYPDSHDCYDGEDDPCDDSVGDEADTGGECQESC